MRGINAFVAHSFNKADRELVGIFLDDLRRLERIHPGNFSWDHAELADAKTLREKVLEKTTGKNVFIAICTKAERVVHAAAKVWSVFSTSWITVAENKCEWKASDWIIQEIGLAIGREMNVVLLLEDGVRKPGGLLGDLEHIPFTRENPETAFGKMMEMLSSISPSEAVGDVSVGAVENSVQTEVESGANEEPRKDWTQGQFESALFRSMFLKEDERTSKIDEMFQLSPLATGAALSKWDARLEWLRLILGRNPNFEKLKRISDENPNDSDILVYVARGHAEFEDHVSSAKAFERAAQQEADEKAALRNWGFAASQYAEAGYTDKCIEILESIKQSDVSADCVNETVLNVLEELAKIEGDDYLQIMVKERRVELRPGDVKTRFLLAYEHGNRDGGDMALYHYDKIPEQFRDASAWNNMGVSFGKIAAPARAVQAFRRAERDNETLAMANLGFKLLSAGFTDEVELICKKALQIENYHKNIPELLSRLKEVPEDERKKIKEALEKVKSKASFFAKSGEALHLLAPKSIRETWISSDCHLSASLEGDLIHLTGNFERESAGLGSIFSLGAVKTITKHKIKYTGRVRGGLIIGEVERSTNAPTALLNLDNGKTEMLAYLNSQMDQLHIIENPQSVNAAIYAINALSGSSTS